MAPRRLLLGALALAACNALSGVADLSFDGVSQCVDDLGCAAPDPCKLGHCGADGACAFAALPDGEPPVQVPGDCKQVSCKGGEPATVADAGDSDDSNPCTADSCSGSEPTHEKLDGTPCGPMGVCEAGECRISCTSATDDCDEGNPCTKDSCDVAAGACVHEPDHGKLVSADPPGDCQQIRCIQDQATAVPDDVEVPDDLNECTVDACDDGVAHNDPGEAGTPCGANLAFECNDSGQCVGCNAPTDCPGLDSECQSRTCINGICGLSKEAEGTSCTGGVCSATGTCVECNSVADCPSGPICATPTCNASVCSSGFVPSGQDPNSECGDAGPATCGTDGTCDGAGACRFYAAGSGCGSGTGCSGGIQTNADQCDGAGACVDGGQFACAPYACGATTCKSACSVAGDCSAGYACNVVTSACVSLPGASCSSAGECSTNSCVDAHCCSVASCPTCKSCGSFGNCQNDPKYAPDAGCAAGKVCDGSGACKQDNGQGCSNDNDCASDNCCSNGPVANTCATLGGC